MIRTKRKINKQRGSRSNGGGCTKKRRGAGNKGGKGKAGMGKQHWTWTVIHDPNHFGKHGFKRPQKMIKKVNSVNLSYLEESEKLYLGIKGVLEDYEIDYVDDFSTEKSRLAYEQGYGVSDYVPFEQNGYPNIHIAQKGIGDFILNENDDPNLIDYRKIKRLSEALSQYIKEVNFS